MIQIEVCSDEYLTPIKDWLRENLKFLEEYNYIRSSGSLIGVSAYYQYSMTIEFKNDEDFNFFKLCLPDNFHLYEVVSYKQMP